MAFGQFLMYDTDWYNDALGFNLLDLDGTATKIGDCSSPLAADFSSPGLQYHFVFRRRDIVFEVLYGQYCCGNFLLF